VLEQKSYVFSLQHFSLGTHFSIGGTVFDKTLNLDAPGMDARDPAVWN